MHTVAHDAHSENQKKNHHTRSLACIRVNNSAKKKRDDKIENKSFNGNKNSSQNKTLITPHKMPLRTVNFIVGGFLFPKISVSKQTHENFVCLQT